jgi:hypothetical protein
VSKFIIIPLIFMISSFRLYDDADTDRYLPFDTSYNRSNRSNASRIAIEVTLVLGDASSGSP